MQNTNIVKKELGVSSDGENIQYTKDIFRTIQKVQESLLTNKDTVTIKGKSYINKRGYRKLSIAFNISTQIVKEVRIVNDNMIIYDFTVRAIHPLGRYTEASASCSSEEREFTHLNNDIRAIAQTRATNRAISDLIGLGELLYEEVYTTNKKRVKAFSEANKGAGGVNQDSITSKQKYLLTKLIKSKYSDRKTQNALIKKIETFSKQYARIKITELLQQGATV